MGVIASDVEGTLTTGATWRGLRAYLFDNGRRGTYYRFFVRQLPGLLLARLGWRDERRFKNDFITDMLTLFREMDEATFQRVSEYVVDTELWPQRRADVVAELTTQRALGHTIVLASGTFQPVLDAFAAKLDAHALGTPIEVREDVLSGKLAGPINVDTVKGRRVAEWLASSSLLRAYGDTIDDLPMLEQSQEPIAVAPDDALADVAAERGWRILLATE